MTDDPCLSWAAQYSWPMARLRTAIVALAIAGSALAGGGFAVAPHLDPPDAPPAHMHPISLYRLPITLTQAGPLAAASGTVIRPAQLEDLLVLLVIAAVAFGAPRAPRPSPRAGRIVMPAPRVARQWAAPVPAGPPRLSTLPLP